ncbi:MAG: preQ(1) synthase [Acidiferrobacterales bacterium]
MPTSPSKRLEIFDNPHPERDYIIAIRIPEFTCLCPKTGQPDFATLYLQYVPDQKCVELKSLKLYVWSYRTEGAFHEDVTNKILSDLVAVINPRYMRLRAKFNVRGGIYTTVIAEHRKPGWTPPPPPPDYLPRWSEGSLTSAPAEKGAAPQAAPVATTRAPAARPVAPAGAANAPPTSAQAAPKDDSIYVGIDFGPTGCRSIAIDATGAVLADAQALIPAPLTSADQVTQDPTLWWKAVSACLQILVSKVDPKRFRVLAVDGTSGTVLLCDNRGRPVTPALMYSDARAVAQADIIAQHCGPTSGAFGASSSLAKLLWLQEKKIDSKATHFLHQADWIVGRLTGLWAHSDYHNSFRLGFDVESRQWPTWLAQVGINASLLPKVHAPGNTVGVVSAETARSFGISPQTQVVAGTTTGVAGFLSAGATLPGHGVTSLGSALSLKLLSDRPVFSREHAVYSHRIGKYWLAGGTSNSGWQVLLQYFDTAQIVEMSNQLDPNQLTGLDYYPLRQVGERFPVNDPKMAPRLEPLPADSITFFQAMLEGIARIEAAGYGLLSKLGAPTLNQVFSIGPGSDNVAWERIRQRVLPVEVKSGRHSSAAYGAALLAAGIIARTFAQPTRTGTSG